MLRTFLRRIGYLEAHHRFGASLVVALVVLAAVHGRVRIPLQIIFSWDGYALCFLFLAWIRMLSSRPHVSARIAQLEHTSRTIVFSFVLVSALASLGAVIFLLGSAHDLHGSDRSLHVLMAVVTVVISWLLVHTLFSLYYANLYYREPCRGSRERARGLDFPGTKQPDYLDFAYFSFVIGMTSQVSDVQISARKIRRWALVHGLISFIFNAAILGLSINTLSSLF
jgi:uncharacterized membrane protein